MHRTVYRMKGTIAYLRAEIDASGMKGVGFTIRPLFLIAQLGYWPRALIPASSSTRFGTRPAPILIPKPSAKCTITAVEEPGETMRVEVEIEDDPAMPGYATVHDRWLHLRRHLGSKLEEPGVEKLNAPANQRPKAKNQTGRHNINAHKDAIQRMVDGQSKEANRYQWKTEYEQETGKDPDKTSSGANELYRKSVWEKYQKLTGKN